MPSNFSIWNYIMLKICNCVILNNLLISTHSYSTQGPHSSLKPLKSLEFSFGSLNPGNSLEFCVKILNPLEICERHKKIDQHRYLFFSLNFILFCHQTVCKKIIDISLECSLECCIDQNKSWNKLEKLLEILFM